jgi:hypothetical protein
VHSICRLGSTFTISLSWIDYLYPRLYTLLMYTYGSSIKDTDGLLSRNFFNLNIVGNDVRVAAYVILHSSY